MSTLLNSILKSMQERKKCFSTQIGAPVVDPTKGIYDTPVEPDPPIPVVCLHNSDPAFEDPWTVSQALQQILSIQEDPLLQVLDSLKKQGMNPSEFRSQTLRLISDMEYILSHIPEDKRHQVIESWNLHFHKFPGFADFRVLEEWLKTRGDRFLFFLLEQAVKFEKEKEGSRKL